MIAASFDQAVLPIKRSLDGNRLWSRRVIGRCRRCTCTQVIALPCFIMTRSASSGARESASVSPQKTEWPDDSRLRSAQTTGLQQSHWTVRIRSPPDRSLRPVEPMSDAVVVRTGLFRIGLHACPQKQSQRFARRGTAAAAEPIQKRNYPASPIIDETSAAVITTDEPRSQHDDAAQT